MYIPRRCLSRSTLFPYTTLFRSLLRLRPHQSLPRRERCPMSRYPEPLTWGQILAYRDAEARDECWCGPRSEEHTSELQSRGHLVCRLLLEKKNRSYICSTTTSDM